MMTTIPTTVFMPGLSSFQVLIRPSTPPAVHILLKTSSIASSMVTSPATYLSKRARVNGDGSRPSILAEAMAAHTCSSRFAFSSTLIVHSSASLRLQFACRTFSDVRSSVAAAGLTGALRDRS